MNRESLILYESLTARELEVLWLIVEGMENKEIAGKLVISPKTVEKHVQNILEKLGMSNRTQAAVWALEHGIVNQKDN